MPITFSTGGLFYAGARAILGAAVRLYFRRIELNRPDRLPTFGPVLLVANHPSSLTDVLVLGAAVDRRLHFLAHSGLFRPWYRGFFLKAAGALPVYRREDEPSLTHRNDDTFRACHELFDRDGVIVIFPEGTSETDRSVKKFKTGAARLALGYDALPGRAGRLSIVPVGLHFTERTAFGSDVVAAVGRPVPMEAARALWAADPEGAVRALTGEMQARIERLTLHVPVAELAELVKEIERLYLDELRASHPEADELSLNRAIGDCVEWYRRANPPRLYDAWSQMRHYRRLLALHNLRDRAVREGVESDSMVRRSARLLTIGAAGLLPAAVGCVVNLWPYKMSEWLGGFFGRDATRVSFARIMCGLVLFPATYGGAAWWLLTRRGWSMAAVAGTLAASALFGTVALAWFKWMKRERHRLRLAWLAWTQRTTVARIRVERRRLIRQIDRARADYEAALASGQATRPVDEWTVPPPAAAQASRPGDVAEAPPSLAVSKAPRPADGRGAAS